MNTTLSYTNISTYCFVELHDLKPLREDLMQLCKVEQLKGTILLSTEGINLFVAGSAESIQHLMDRLHQIPGLEQLTPKVSYSNHQPFNRMLVRIKKEIISFGVEAVRPANYTSPKIQAKELKRWLDEGKPVTLLDTRNDYEVKLGTFKGAIDPNIHTFRQFPDAVRALPAELKDQPVVMFCTGGIRCEKAGPFMEMEGFQQIYQLDGGILKYFEECGGDHYDGECFVFDQRVGVDPALQETETTVCYACQAPLSKEDQEDPRYVLGESCGFCYESDEEKRAKQLASNQAKVNQLCHPLPGSELRENHRPIHIPVALEKKTLLESLLALFPHVSEEEWKKRDAEQRFVSYGGIPRGLDHIVHGGERILQVFPPAVEPEVATDIRLVYDDEMILVVQKPAPLPMHPSGRFHRNTLQYILNEAYKPHFPKLVHRLDANTSGLVLFARTRHFSHILQRQMLDGNIKKRYLVEVGGKVEQEHFVCEVPISDQTGVLGSRKIDEDNGLYARTEFRVLKYLDHGNTLLEATLCTGRTNQIRLHLASMNIPIIGDATYLKEDEIGDVQTLPIDAPPLRLHAWKLDFKHPNTGEELHFEASLPSWLTTLG